MKKIKWFLKLLGMTTSMGWRAHVSYMGWSALVHGIGLIVGYFGEYLVIYMMVQNFSDIGGFGAMEVCFMYAMGLTTYALGNLYTREFWNMRELVLRGKLDMVLVRPISPLLFLFVNDIQVGYISHLVLGVGSMMAIKGATGLYWDAAHWALFLFTLLSGGALMGGISIIATPLTFWWGDARAVTSFVRWDMKDAIRYPISIYPKGVQFLLYVVPYAFVSYIPCLYLLNKDLSNTAFLYPLSVLGAAIVINAAFCFFWREGLKRYSSAG